MARIIEITDLSVSELAPYVSLTEAQMKDRSGKNQGIFIAEGHIVIQSALEAGYEPVSMLMEKKHLISSAALLESLPALPVYTADESLLARLTGYRMHRGFLCAMKRPPLKSAADVCMNARRIAVVENLVDPSNIGAIFRSAAALGMDGLLLSPSCCDPLYRKAVRVSMGSVFRLPWAWLSDGWPTEGIRFLHEEGFTVLAMALRKNSLSLTDSALKDHEKLAIILGNEGNGLEDDTISLADASVIIPMSHGIDSLNVAAAGAVAFWQLGIHSA